METDLVEIVVFVVIIKLLLLLMMYLGRAEQNQCGGTSGQHEWSAWQPTEAKTNDGEWAAFDWRECRHCSIRECKRR